MFGIRAFLVGATVGGGAMYVAHHYHVVRTGSEFLLVSRSEQVPLRSTYADIREWDAVTWAQYPELAVALLKGGHQKLLERMANGPATPEAQPATSWPQVPPPAAGTTLTTNHPPIVFDPALQAGAALPRPVTGTPATAPAASREQGVPGVPGPVTEDESLLGRLSRQLSTGAAATESAAELRSRPLLRETIQQPPAATPATPTHAPTPPARPDQAAAPAPRPTSGLLATVHSAAVDRIATRLEQALERAGEVPETVPRPSAVVSQSEESPTVGLASTSAAPSAAANGAQEILPPSPGGTGELLMRLPISASAAAFPVELDADQLRARVPAAVIDQLRSLAPTDGP